ncbi:hypothetical protein [Thiomonas bhubaneswarensis]|uniref:Uncharacterized protein n=1 Tax=Thiomonas bhubaneswarensis TaxID=339866 RepID=A0A0K6I0K8_9BURK|nr:hypothetical protein [Thiomonas bhubaneswarensis]CUA96606.1 hypothetical protein Ga0061069_104213 [Thiomonas bhubaneswarensis]
MDDATINPVGAYDPVSRLPDGGGRGRQQSPERKPRAGRQPPEGSAPAGTPDAPPAETPDPDAPRGRYIDDRA